MQFGSTTQGRNPRSLIQSGESTFNSVTGRLIYLQSIIPKDQYEVDISPSENPAGLLGEVWVVKTDNSFTVYNSGTATTKFRFKVVSVTNALYQVLTTTHKHVASDLTDLSNIGNGSPKGTASTLAALQVSYPNGTTGIYVVAADGKWYYWNGSAWTAGGTYQATSLAAGSVTEQNLAFVPAVARKSINLFDKSLAVDNKYQVTNASYTTDLAGYFVSGWITIKPNQTYTLRYSSSYYIQGDNTGGTGSTFTTGASATSVRFSTNGLTLKDTQQLQEGIAFTSYEPFRNIYPPLADSIGTEELKNAGVTNPKLAVDSVTTDKINMKGFLHGFPVGTAPVNFDFTNTKVILPPFFKVIADGKMYGVTGGSPTEIAMPTSLPNPVLLVVDKVTNVYNVVTPDAAAYNTYNTLTKNSIIVASFWGRNYPVYMLGNYLIDGQVPDFSTGNCLYGIYTGNSLVNIDTVNSKIIIPTYGAVNYGTGRYGWRGTGTTELVITPGASMFFGVNKNTDVWFIKLPGALLKTDIVLGSTYTGRLFMAGPYLINGKPAIGVGSITRDLIDPAAYVPVYTEATDRILFSPHVFIAKGIKLPIYKSTLLTSVDKNAFAAVKTFVSYTDTDGTPNFDCFDENYNLDGEVIKGDFSLIARPDIHGSYYEYPVTRHYIDPATKTSSTPKCLMIGDSLTNRYIIQFTKEKIIAVGVTPTMVGTMANLTGVNGEGREAWGWQHFIGQNNVYGTRIFPQASGSTSDLNKNPFIRLATTEEKTTTPTWCFRNTGAIKELNYTEDSDKTGDFYIFDFAYYLTNHGVTNPDIVTIGLGTNDINLYTNAITTSYLDVCRLGMEIMLKSIRTALPNAKIAVIPSPVWGNSTMGYWNNYASTWVENCIKDIETLGIANVYVLPVWAHMNASFVWPTTSASVTSLSKELKQTPSDSVHFGTYGQKQYANAVASFMVNML